MSITTASQKQTLQDPRTGMLQRAGASIRNLGKTAVNAASSTLNLNDGLHKEADNSPKEVKSYKELKKDIKTYTEITTTFQKGLEELLKNINTLTEHCSVAEKYSKKLQGLSLQFAEHTNHPPISLDKIISLFPDIAEKHETKALKEDEFIADWAHDTCLEQVIEKLSSVGLIEDGTQNIAEYVEKWATNQGIITQKPRLEKLAAEWRSLTAEPQANV